MQGRVHYALMVAGVMGAAVVVLVAVRAAGAQQVVKCYFKDCLVFEDGSRLCEVKEIPCPNEA
ncbi:MAG TPA: hypothetical protein VF006_09665 [Longimicrobium sp.]